MQSRCSTHGQPVRGTVHRFVVRLAWCMAVPALLGACGDGAPPTAPRIRPDSALKNFSTVIDWYDCASFDQGNSWNCYYSHTTDYGSTGPPDDHWSYQTWWTKTRNCQIHASYCDYHFRHPGAGSGYPNPYSPYSPLAGEAQHDVEAPQGRDLRVPVCTSTPQSDPYKRAYCSAGGPPASSQAVLIREALERMRQKGGICAALANIGETLLNQGTLRVFSQSTFDFGGYAPVKGATPAWGGPTGPYAWAVISSNYTGYFWNHTKRANPASEIYRSYPYTLQSALAHELDHLNGAFHIPYGHPEASLWQQPGKSHDKWTTPNTRTSSDAEP